MTAEAAFSATVKGPRQELFTLRGDDYSTFYNNVIEALGQEAGDKFLDGFTTAFSGQGTMPTAVANVTNGFPQASTVGGTAAPASTFVVPGAPPFTPDPPVANPGNCAHGPRVYVDKPARGKPWRRWECAIPWSKDMAASRCQPVNV